MAERYEKQLLKSKEFIDKAEKIRKIHPELGCRKIALKLQEGSFGRDKLENLLLTSGFRVLYPPNYIKTTRSVIRHKFKNLVEGLLVKDINKVVQSDITYFWMNGRFGYLVFIIDVYSKLIVGYNASFGMEASGNISALNMMIRLRGKENVRQMIHHSDRGSQFHCSRYLEVLKKYDIKVSMCNEAWENAYAERINRTIKNEYLRHRRINTLAELKRQLTIVVKAYNNDRPHRNLMAQMPPAIFEQYLFSMPRSKRPVVRIYKSERK